MPLTFSEPPGRRMSTGRRPSASSPYPVRVMTAIKPTDYPSPPKYRCSSASPKKEPSADPFLDGVGDCTAAECAAPGLDCHTGSPQDERVVQPDAEAGELQPLLGRRAPSPGARARRWTLLAGLVLVLVVGGVIAGGVVRMQVEGGRQVPAERAEAV